MKKIKRAESKGCNKSSKALPNTKTNSSVTTIRNKPKKHILRQVGNKQNILIVDSDEINGKGVYSYKKKITQKKNSRSKSLIYDKKTTSKIARTHDSSRTIDHLQCFNIQKSRNDIIFTSINGENIPQDKKHQKAVSTITDFSPENKNKRYDFSTQTKKQLILDAQIQCQQFQLEEHPEQINKIQQCEKEKQRLKDRIRQLQVKINELNFQTQQKQIRFRNHYKNQNKQLNRHILQLKEQNLHLSNQRQTLKVIVKAKQQQINKSKEKQRQFETALKSELVFKQALIKENQKSKKEIEFYKRQLKSFEESLIDLRKMKGVYESRLDELEHQKIRIKRSAQQLLQIVERYKKQEESD